MDGRFMMENPEKLMATMKITASVKEWEELRDQLTRDWPSWQFSNLITDLITQARKVIYPTVEQP